jgi:hypothetical protein
VGDEAKSDSVADRSASFERMSSALIDVATGQKALPAKTPE